jgi:PPK2 family polyphosphate:nucleotide phosphotransferase
MDLSHKLLLKPKKESNQIITLKDWNPDLDLGKSKKDVDQGLSEIFNHLTELQYKLFAENSQSLLIILQGMDTSGKDGTIRKVMQALNPQSCYVKSFKIPSEEEYSHDYLWRVHKAIPPKGHIAIFNRSHYEDLIDFRVNCLSSKSDVALRCRQINDFEIYLSENKVTILKFFLHISKDEQKKRLQERLKDPTKHWKISESDFVSHRNWNKYIEAYEFALRLCNTKCAPWYIIPSNVKHFRNWAVAQIVISTLVNMNPKFPSSKLDVSKFVFD